MKHCTKIIRSFLVISFVVTLFIFSAPALNADFYWSPGMTIPDHSGKVAPALALYNGQIHMVYAGSRGKFLRHSYYDGISWSQEVKLSLTSQTSPGLAVFNNQLHMVYVNSSNTSLYHSVYNGSTWSSGSVVLSEKSNVPPALVAYNNLLHLVHKNDTSTAVNHATYNGTSWTSLGSISGQATKSTPALAIFNNQLHMVHQGGTSNDLWHSYYNGTSWTTQAQVLSLMAGAAPGLAECNGALHLANKSDSSTDIYHSTFNGTTWTTLGTLTDHGTSAGTALAAYNGVMHTVHLGATSSTLYSGVYLPQTCAIPAYQPAFWNVYSDILRNNNCYNYSNNKRTDTFAQPGRASGQMYTALTCAAVEPAAVADGIVKLVGTDCEDGKNKIALVVAPDMDYHWYRMDSNGYWSHKPGGTAATNLDNSGNIITNPETADRGAYTDFCCYFCTCSSDIQGISNEIIRAAFIESLNAQNATITAEPEEEGLKVTVLLFSGRTNPSFVIPASEIGNKKMIRELFDTAKKNTKFRGQSVTPSKLGYNGLMIEKVGEVKDFPYQRAYIYKENIEIDGTLTEGKQFLLDGGRNIEDFLIQLATEKGALNARMLKHIK
jgi:hypothetical protein